MSLACGRGGARCAEVYATRAVCTVCVSVCVGVGGGGGGGSACAKPANVSTKLSFKSLKSDLLSLYNSQKEFVRTCMVDMLVESNICSPKKLPGQTRGGEDECVCGIYWAWVG